MRKILVWFSVEFRFAVRDRYDRPRQQLSRIQFVLRFMPASLAFFLDESKTRSAHGQFEICASYISQADVHSTLDHFEVIAVYTVVKVYTQKITKLSDASR